MRLAEVLPIPLAASTSQDPITALQTLAPLVMVAGVVLMGIMLTISIRGKIARRNHDTPTPRELIDAIKKRGGAAVDPGGREEITVQTHDAARRLTAQLDAKAERIEQLIVEAEACIARLEGVIETDIEVSPTGPLIEHEAPAQPGDAAALDDDMTLPESGGYDPPMPGAASRSPAALGVERSLSQRIYELADAGRAPIEIARDLGEHVGKVELILALRG